MLNDNRCAKTERFLRIILAILFVLPIIFMVKLASYIGVIVSIPYIIVSLYLFFNRRYHLIFNSILLLIAVYIYFFSDNSFFSYYKLVPLAHVPGLDDTTTFNRIFLDIAFVGNKFLFILAASWLVIGDILVKVKNTALDAQRGLISGGILIILAVILLILPFAYQPKVHLGLASSGDSHGNSTNHFTMINTDMKMSFNELTHQYEYTAILKNNTDEIGPISRIVVDAHDLNIATNQMLSVENATIQAGVINIAAKKTGIVKISSEKPFYCVALFEQDFKYQSCFLK